MKGCKYTEEQVDHMLESIVANVGTMRTPSDMGVESNRKVRICRVMKAAELNRCCQQARSQIHCTGTVVNLMADFALRETIQRLKADKLFKHETKKICNELQGIILQWKTDMKALLWERYEAMEDVAYDRQSEIMGDVDQLRMQLKQNFFKCGCKYADTAAWVEMTQQMFVLSHIVVRAVVTAWYTDANIDLSDVFAHMDLLRLCSRKWQKVCMKFYTYEQQTGAIQNDQNVENALKILSHHAIDYDGLWKHFKNALEEHADVFSEQNRKEIDADIEDIKKRGEKKRREAKKANADYWAKTKRTAKPRASDATDEDIQQLINHFS